MRELGTHVTTGLTGISFQWNKLKNEVEVVYDGIKIELTQIRKIQNKYGDSETFSTRR